ncbi:hypothetical protein HZA39_00640 [Candidatus Peregrinibacteria bacterium]|nr:hypothetical protein [Candidatus Peregrinibacteria bacterium]
MSGPNETNETPKKWKKPERVRRYGVFERACQGEDLFPPIKKPESEDAIKQSPESDKIHDVAVQTKKKLENLKIPNEK